MLYLIAEPTIHSEVKAILNKSIGLKNFLDGFMKFKEIYTQKEESLYNHIYLLNRKVPVKWKALLAAYHLLGFIHAKNDRNNS